MSCAARLCAIVLLALYADAHGDDWAACEAIVDRALSREHPTVVLTRGVERGLDPWVLAEVLVSRRAQKQAKLFANSLPRSPTRARLIDYVTARDWTAQDKGALQQFRLAHRRRMRNEPQAVVSAAVRVGSVLEALAASERAAALRDSDRLAEGDSAAVVASRLAMGIGWIDGASSMLKWAFYNQFWGAKYQIQERQIAKIRLSLAGPAEAALLYADILGELVCVAMTRSDVFFLPVGNLKTITQACASLSPPRPHKVAPGLKAIRGLVDPLKYLGQIDSVIVISTDDVATRVPFCALSAVPSVSYRNFDALRSLRAKRKRPKGKGVLGVGNDTVPPSFDTLVAPGAETFARATARRRWSVVHLACRFDRKRGRFLALGTNEPVTRVFSLREVKADLLVLSGSRTGLYLRPGEPELYRSLRDVLPGAIDAFVGLRAHGNKAGPPMRTLSANTGYGMLLVHLWHQDESASRVLLGRFRALWMDAGRPDVAAAAALLRKAQQHVAAKAEWKDPYFWAGWQLWGVP